MDHVLRSRVALGVYLMLATCGPADTEDSSGLIDALKDHTDACDVSAEDADWIGRSIQAWHFTNRTITKKTDIKDLDAVFFNTNCQMTGNGVLETASNSNWVIKSHNGMVLLPDGDKMPPVVTSFTSVSDNDGRAFFVMSTPSIWRDGGVTSQMGLEMLMTAVMLHEAIHAIQSSTYGQEITRLSIEHSLPDSFNDDSIQRIFEENADFADSITQETDLYMQAALAGTETEARIFLQTALDLTTTRYEKWFTGGDEKYREIDDVWLTMEGSGQWAGYQWLIAPEGGDLSEETAVTEFGLRGRWWSQKLGFSMFMALDRLSDDWETEAFGEGGATILDMLQEVIANTG